MYRYRDRHQQMDQEPLDRWLVSYADYVTLMFALFVVLYSLAIAKEAGAPVFAYGAFITAVINFLIIAWVVFLLVKGVNSMKDAAIKKKEAAPAAPAGPSQEELLTEILATLKSRSV